MSEELFIDGYPRRWVYNGVQTLSLYPDYALDSIPNYIPDKHDVFVCTFPKAGTVWCQDICYQLLFGEAIDDIDRFDFDPDRPWMERDGGGKVRESMVPRIIKTHFAIGEKKEVAYDSLQYTPEGKYVFCVRNPLDSLVSMYHHQIAAKRFCFEDGSFDNFFDIWMEGKVVHGDYFEFILSMIKYMDKENVVFLKFEDMKKDLLKGVTKIAKFFKKFEDDFPRPIPSTPEELQVVATNSYLPNMKKRNPQTSFWNKGKSHVRSGKVGGWKEYMSPEQLERMEEKWNQKLGGTVAESWFKKYGFPRSE